MNGIGVFTKFYSNCRETKFAQNLFTDVEKFRTTPLHIFSAIFSGRLRTLESFNREPNSERSSNRGVLRAVLILRNDVCWSQVGTSERLRHSGIVVLLQDLRNAQKAVVEK